MENAALNIAKPPKCLDDSEISKLGDLDVVQLTLKSHLFPGSSEIINSIIALKQKQEEEEKEKEKRIRVQEQRIREQEQRIREQEHEYRMALLKLQKGRGKFKNTIIINLFSIIFHRRD